MTGPNVAAPVELSPDVYRQFEAEQAADLAAEFDDFDAYWRTKNPVRPTRIRGVMVTPPIDMPLEMVEQVDRAQGSTDLDAIKAVLSGVYGQGIVERWTTAGMGLREFSVVLAWSGSHMRGEPVDFERAYQLATEAMAEAEARGKAPNNRQERRSRKRSAAGGG